MSLTSVRLMEAQAQREMDELDEHVQAQERVRSGKTPVRQLKSAANELYLDWRQQLPAATRRLHRETLIFTIELTETLASDLVEAALDKFRQLGWTAEHGCGDGRPIYDQVQLTVPADWLERLLSGSVPARRRARAESRSPVWTPPRSRRSR